MNPEASLTKRHYDCIDILLPFYGDVGYLREAVHSVLSQTDPSWRLIVTDDAYPDPAVRSWFAELAHPAVTYYRNSTNVGANENYRRALALAEAPHVVVMGADDILLPNYVATVREALAKRPNVAVVQPGVRTIDASGQQHTPLVDRIKRWSAPRVQGEDVNRVLAGERLARSLLRGNWTYFPSLCWRREAITKIGFRPEFNVAQDLALLLDVVATGGSMLVIPEIVFLYRRHAASDSSVRALTGSRFAEERLLFAEMKRECDKRGWARAARAAQLHLTSRMHAVAKLPVCAKTGDWQGSWELSKHALLP